MVLCPVYTANRTPLNWKHPEDFVPERFMREGQAEYASDRREALQPFSFGPRNCVGKK
jgi:cytochrome P450